MGAKGVTKAAKVAMAVRGAIVPITEVTAVREVTTIADITVTIMLTIVREVTTAKAVTSRTAGAVSVRREREAVIVVRSKEVTGRTVSADVRRGVARGMIPMRNTVIRNRLNTRNSMWIRTHQSA